jgi:hypothetical protein
LKHGGETAQGTPPWQGWQKDRKEKQVCQC